MLDKMLNKPQPYQLPVPTQPIRRLDPILAAALAAQGYDPEAERLRFNEGITARQQAASAEDGADG